MTADATNPRIWLAPGTVEPEFARHVRDIVEDGGRDADIAEILGISENVAKNVRLALGIRFGPTPAPMVQASRIRAMHAAGLVTREIAARTGLTYRTTQQRLADLGLRANRSGRTGARSGNLHIRASAEELARINTAASEAGLSVSEWVRTMLGLI